MKNDEKNTIFFPIAVALSLSAVVVVLTGCANTLGGLNGYYANSSGSYSSSALAGDSGVDDYIVIGGTPYGCPDKANVVPSNDTNFNGTDHFRVCNSTSALEKIVIYGSTQYSSTICAFPALASDSGVNVFRNGVGSAYSMCARTDTGSPVIAFDKSITFNAVFIVEAPFESAMRTCLTTGDRYSCPQYSYGIFRQTPVAGSGQ